MKKAKPFIKWAGGKNGLVSQLIKFLPSKFNRYHEPFLGGGALFYVLRPKKSFLNDINKNLISTYQDIKTKPREIIDLLSKIEKEYNAKTETEKKKYYYKIRDEYNKLNCTLTKSAYLIFLNKTCYNGMYRENSLGEFNIPFGRHGDLKILDKDNILASSSLLKKSSLTSLSFYESAKDVKKHDLVYFDPPYYPLTKTSSFTKYTDKNFSIDDHKTLKKLTDNLTKKGCYVMISNSYSDFIIKLFKNYRQETIYANRAINCKAHKRGKIKELLILNF